MSDESASQSTQNEMRLQYETMMYNLLGWHLFGRREEVEYNAYKSWPSVIWVSDPEQCLCEHEVVGGMPPLVRRLFCNSLRLLSASFQNEAEKQEVRRRREPCSIDEGRSSSPQFTRHGVGDSLQIRPLSFPFLYLNLLPLTGSSAILLGFPNDFQ